MIMKIICIFFFLAIVDMLYAMREQLEKIHCDLNNLISRSEDTKEIIDELKDIIFILNKKGMY